MLIFNFLFTFKNVTFIMRDPGNNKRCSSKSLLPFLSSVLFLPPCLLVLQGAEMLPQMGCACEVRARRVCSVSASVQILFLYKWEHTACIVSNSFLILSLRPHCKGIYEEFLQPSFIFFKSNFGLILIHSFCYLRLFRHFYSTF